MAVPPPRQQALADEQVLMGKSEVWIWTAVFEACVGLAGPTGIP